MRIYRFMEYGRVNEAHNDPPEQYIKNALLKIKSKLERMFAQSPGGTPEVRKFGEKDKSPSTAIADLGVELESIEISRHSRNFENVRVKFSDEQNLYDLMVAIRLADALPSNDKEFSVDDIDKCVIKLKKYDKAEPGEVLAEIIDNVKVDDIDEDLLVELKLKLDEESGEEPEDEFQIETD